MTKDEEITRLTLKVQQYQQQLDDRWAGVVGVTNHHVKRLKRVQAMMKRIVYGLQQADWDNNGPLCWRHTCGTGENSCTAISDRWRQKLITDIAALEAEL